jgi:hypothetical protein
MNWKGYGREQSWSNDTPTAHDLSGGNEENKKPQSGEPVCKQRAEPRQH